jgi:hypothetical protein
VSWTVAGLLWVIALSTPTRAHPASDVYQYPGFGGIEVWRGADPQVEWHFTREVNGDQKRESIRWKGISPGSS